MVQDAGAQAVQDADEQTFDVDSWPLLIMYLAQLPQDEGRYVFRLTHDLQSPEFYEGIVVARRSVVIDLNGYNIAGNEGDNASSAHHFAIVNNGGTLTIQDSSEEGTGSITGFSAEQGGAILVEDGGELRVLGGIISGNNATTGGGIAVTGGSVSVTGGSFTSNSATQGGGIAVIGGSVSVTGGSFTSNSATQGGGVAVFGGSISVTGGSVADNSCSSNGGGVYVGTQGHFEISESPLIGHNLKKSPDVTDDIVQDVYLETGAIITTAGELGYADAIVVDVQDPPGRKQTRVIATPGSYGSQAFTHQTNEGCEIYYETNTDGQNVAFIQRVYELAYSWADLAQKLRTVKKNEEAIFKLARDAEYGTGTPDEFAAYPLEIRKGAKITLDLNGYRIDRMLSNKSTPSMEDSERCLYVSKGSLTIRDSRGGGKVTGGCCQHGGGVFIADGTLVLESGSIAGNKATYGGGVYVGMGSFELKGGSVTGNIGLGKGIPCGGGVHVGDNSVLPPVMILEDEDEEDQTVGKVTQGNMTMTGGSIDGNKAAGWGAGVCASNGILTISGGTVSRNVQLEGAAQGGGGVYARGGSTVDLQGGSICENQLFGNDGAGIGITDNSTATFGAATIARNINTKGDGGGVMVYASQLTINGTQICDNKAEHSEGSGGGVLVRHGATCTFNDGSITGNYAENNGGGLYVDGELFVKGGAISGNEADNVGDGICLNKSADARLVLSGAPLISDNHAANDVATREQETYEDIFINVENSGKEDEHQVVEVEGAFTPPSPVCIAKGWGTISPPVELTPIVAKGDYDISDFVTSQPQRDFYDNGQQKLQYTLFQRDNGVLYIHAHAHIWTVRQSQSIRDRLNVYCHGSTNCPYSANPAVLEMKVEYRSSDGNATTANDAQYAFAYIERLNTPSDFEYGGTPISYYKGFYWPCEGYPIGGPPREPGSYVAVSHITVAGKSVGYLWTTFTLGSQNGSDGFSDVEENPQNATPQAGQDNSQDSQDNSSSQTPKQSGQNRTSTQHVTAASSSHATSHASQGATLPQTSDIPMGPVETLGLLGAASLLGAHVIRRRKCA